MDDSNFAKDQHDDAINFRQLLKHMFSQMVKGIIFVRDGPSDEPWSKFLPEGRYILGALGS